MSFINNISVLHQIYVINADDIATQKSDKDLMTAIRLNTAIFMANGTNAHIKINGSIWLRKVKKEKYHESTELHLCNLSNKYRYATSDDIFWVLIQPKKNTKIDTLYKCKTNDRNKSKNIDYCNCSETFSSILMIAHNDDFISWYST